MIKTKKFVCENYAYIKHDYTFTNRWTKRKNTIKAGTRFRLVGAAPEAFRYDNGAIVLVNFYGRGKDLLIGAKHTE
jgi:hypothetical protein